MVKCMYLGLLSWLRCRYVRKDLDHLTFELKCIILVLLEAGPSLLLMCLFIFKVPFVV